MGFVLTRQTLYISPGSDEGTENGLAYLRCPECRLTVPATAYYLRGDQCPRCMTVMEPTDRFREPRPTVRDKRSSPDSVPTHTRAA
jgi:hypothetical protein